MALQLCLGKGMAYKGTLWRNVRQQCLTVCALCITFTEPLLGKSCEVPEIRAAITLMHEIAVFYTIPIKDC